MQVLVRDNNVDQALKALKKKMQREGIFREMKLRGHYEKPSEKKAREKAEAVRRARKLARKKLQREGLLPMKPKPVFGAGAGGDRGAGRGPGAGPRPGAPRLSAQTDLTMFQARACSPRFYFACCKRERCCAGDAADDHPAILASGDFVPSILRNAGLTCPSMVPTKAKAADPWPPL